MCVDMVALLLEFVRRVSLRRQLCGEGDRPMCDVVNVHMLWSDQSVLDWSWLGGQEWRVCSRA